MFKPNKSEIKTKRDAEKALKFVEIAPSEFHRKLILFKNVKLLENNVPLISSKFGNHTEKAKMMRARIIANSVYLGEHIISRYMDFHAVYMFCNIFILFKFAIYNLRENRIWLCPYYLLVIDEKSRC